MDNEETQEAAPAAAPRPGLRVGKGEFFLVGGFNVLDADLNEVQNVPLVHPETGQAIKGIPVRTLDAKGILEALEVAVKARDFYQQQIDQQTAQE
jgi:hypothetical protein